MGPQWQGVKAAGADVELWLPLQMAGAVTTEQAQFPVHHLELLLGSQEEMSSHRAESASVRFSDLCGY